MINVRKAQERGHFDHGWLNTFHSFSFGDYYDPGHMGFRSLRVINEDRIHPGLGFGMHGHQDMEIITYILDGELEHRDNMGNGAVLKRGELQHMTAGTGIRHSEFNPSKTNPVHLYQIWLTPWRKGLVPSYSQTKVDESTADKQLRLIASPDGHNGSLAICQDAKIYLSSLAGSESVHYSVSPSRAVWVQVLRGEVKVLGQVLRDGDGAAITNESDLSLATVGNGFSEVMLFDLP